jgi:phosphoglycolate phosphatase-like HAD superfamily hydrolase
VFDCDGVIFDSNQLKIDAMGKALQQYCADQPEAVAACVEYFSANFGQSRYHHVQYFVDTMLVVDSHQKQALHDGILAAYSNQCFALYLAAAMPTGLLDFIRASPATKYVASGSDQAELRRVFSARGIDHFFAGIMGSPAKKSELVATVRATHGNASILMIGDAVSDWQAARAHGVDFLFYAPLSNVIPEMLSLSEEYGFEVCDNFAELAEVFGGSLNHG